MFRIEVPSSSSMELPVSTLGQGHQAQHQQQEQPQDPEAAALYQSQELGRVILPHEQHEQQEEISHHQRGGHHASHRKGAAAGGGLANPFPVDTAVLATLQSGDAKSALAGLGGVPGVAQALRVDPEGGIPEDDDVDKRARQEAFGTNTYPEAPQKGFFTFAWEATCNPILVILMVCAVVSLVFKMLDYGPAKGWYDGAAILTAIIVVILVSASVEYAQARQFRGLSAEKANIPIKVLRGGRMQTISIFDLLVGDVVPLAIGDQVPGDGLFLSGHSLLIDESSMTGESDPIHKSAEAPVLLSGCKVLDGVGTMMVTGVGMNTEWGRIMATLNEEEVVVTPLQERLTRLATSIAKVGCTVAGLVFLVLLIRYFAIDFNPTSVVDALTGISDIFLVSVTIIVVAIPEGLPLAVTITLAVSMRKMMKDKALVRRLSACETAGSATTICSDKTGTLTLNQMTVVEAWMGEKLRPVDGGRVPGGLLWEMLSEGVAQNGNASVFVQPGGEVEVTASPTESAVVNWAIQMGLDFNGVRQQSQVRAVVPFNSAKKRGGATVQQPKGGRARVHWKGGADIILGLSTSWVGEDGTLQPITEEVREDIELSINNMAVCSLRCVAIACRDLAPAEVPPAVEQDKDEAWTVPDDSLSLLAIVGIKDPCRPGVPDAVAACQLAGVKVRMVTGDNPLTAKAIAEECGILTPHGRVIEGKDFRVLDDAARRAILPHIDVMARSSPTDKHLLVQTLREMGEVVAVTGDGTNDAPALKEADIGLSMGIAGTEVAKESSDIVILDDNFSSIVRAISWGRSVFANVQRFLQFQLTVNVGALTINFVTACTSGINVPLTTVQLLWVNLLMNTMAALALATEPPTPDLLKQAPVGRTAPIVSNIMWRNILCMAAWQVTVLLTLYYVGAAWLGMDDPVVDRTVIFNSFVFSQLFNEFNARRPTKFNVFEGLHRNPLFIGVLVVSVVMQFVMVEFLNDFASTTPLGWQQWVFCILIGSLSLPLAALFKLIPVPSTPFGDIIAAFVMKLLKRGSPADAEPADSAAAAVGGGQGNTSGRV